MTRHRYQQESGPNELAKKLQLNEVLSSGVRTADEGLYANPARLLGGMSSATQSRWMRL